jgi:hypothetical protein
MYGGWSHLDLRLDDRDLVIDVIIDDRIIASVGASRAVRLDAGLPALQLFERGIRWVRRRFRDRVGQRRRLRERQPADGRKFGGRRLGPI